MIDCVCKVEAALVMKSKALNFLINDQLEENPQKKSDCIEVYEKNDRTFYLTYDLNKHYPQTFVISVTSFGSY